MVRIKSNNKSTLYLIGAKYLEEVVIIVLHMTEKSEFI
jgi:hypothetical protein